MRVAAAEYHERGAPDGIAELIDSLGCARDDNVGQAVAIEVGSQKLVRVRNACQTTRSRTAERGRWRLP